MKEKREVQLKILVTKSEKELLEKKAEEARLNLSNYIRTKIFKK